MKVEDCIVAVERRTLGGCVDLAFIFVRTFMLPIAILTLTFAVPCCILAWWLAEAQQTDVLPVALLVFAGFNTIYGGALVAAVGPQVFGDSISTTAAIRSVGKRFISYTFLGLLTRIPTACMFVPGLFIYPWCGHLAEVMFLENTSLSGISERLSWLGQRGGYSRNLGRCTGLILLWALMAFGLALLIDLLVSILFNVPSVIDSVTGSATNPDAEMARQSQLYDSPLVVTVVLACVWATAPVIRVAWFFCYLDQRIRNECWDIELLYRAEATRLRKQAP